MWHEHLEILAQSLQWRRLIYMVQRYTHAVWYRVGRPLVPKVLLTVFWEFPRLLVFTAAAMLPKQARGTYKKHITKPLEQVAAHFVSYNNWWLDALSCRYRLECHSNIVFIPRAIEYQGNDSSSSSAAAWPIKSACHGWQGRQRLKTFYFYCGATEYSGLGFHSCY